MSAGFTPGPWKSVGYCGFWIIGSGDKPRYPRNHICQIFDDRDSYAAGQVDANANLIAAAPDLYAALSDAVELLQMSGCSTLEHTDALAKARGEQ